MKLKRIKRFIQSKFIIIFYRLRDILHKNSLHVDWYSKTNNFGDILNYTLLKSISNQDVLQIRSHLYNKKNYLVIGSILQRATKHSVIWGSGFISYNSHCEEIPAKICAVRGPLTRDKLLLDNIECPEVYGDPALLLPRIYFPRIKKKYKLGIVPHYLDRNSNWVKNITNNNEIVVLDIQMHEPLKFVEKILECEKIASSSLHGIIVADAYLIPSLWISLSNNITGGDFKYLDYFLSVKRIDKKAFIIKEKTKLNEIFNSFYNYNIDINLDKLVLACPFEITFKKEVENEK